MLKLVCILLIQCNLTHHTFGQFYPSPPLSQLKIGGIFEKDDMEMEVILKQAVEHLNRDNTILPNHHLSVLPESTISENSFYVRKNVCNLLKEGVVGIFGPQISETVSHTQALCDRYDIPHIATRWDYRTRQDKSTINLYPHPDIIGEAFRNLVDEINWKDLVILYDSRENRFNLQGLVKASKPTKRNVMLRMLAKDGNFRPLLKSLQRDYDVKRLIIDCEHDIALKLLKQAQEIGMIRYDYEYILTTLNLQPWDLDEFINGDARVVAFRMVDPEKPDVWNIITELNSVSPPQHNQFQDPSSAKPRGISTEEALVYDAVKLFGKALEENLQSLNLIQPIICEQDDAWAVGSSIVNSMRSMSPFQGLTGVVQFNNSGFRTDIVLEVVALSNKGFRKIGIWEYARNFKNRFIWTSGKAEAPSNEIYRMPLWNRTLTVITIMTNPFCMNKLSEDVLEGNARYEGFTVDLLEELHKKMGFKYEIKLVEDGTHDGMIDEVFNKKGDIVIADLTVTKDRQKKLDFTMPFMNLGISILFTQPQAKPPSLFSFMSPFSGDVWTYVAFSFFGVSFVLFTVGRLSPYEWENSFPCITDPDKLQNQFSLKNSFWFTIGSIMQQGSDLTPKSASTRMIAGTWWCFTLIMVSSYTANLASFLIVQELEESFSSLKELASQNKIQYGCLQNGSTMKFFQNSNDPIKQVIWKNMERNREISLTSSNDEGVNSVRARPGKFAFFMESTIIEYYMERKCRLVQIGGLLDHKGYGIALHKESPPEYLDLFNAAILTLQEQGDLDRLKRKWWKEEGKEFAETCPTASVSDTVKPLELANVGGVFVVLVCGCIGAMLITFIEFVRNSRAMKAKGESLKHEILKDLHFALQCRGNVKPVKKNSMSSVFVGGAEDGLRSLKREVSP